MSTPVPTRTPDATLARELEWFEAFIQGDARRIATLLTADYLATNHDGTLVERETLLDAIETRQFVVRSVEVEDRRVHRYGDFVSIVTGRSRWNGSLRGCDSTGTVRHTIVWVRLGAYWKVASWHATLLSEEKGVPLGTSL